MRVATRKSLRCPGQGERPHQYIAMAVAFAIGMLAAVVNMGGLGLGPLLAGMISQYLPWPLHLVYALYLILLLSVATLGLLWRHRTHAVVVAG